MLPARLHRMRMITAIVGIPALLTACGGGGTLIDGTLLDADDARQVWVEDGADPVLVESLGFRLEDVRGDTIDLLFGGGSDEVGRMRIIGAGRASRVTLHGVWFDDQVAFPSSIELDGAPVVQINGLRMGATDQLGARVDARGTLLSLSRNREQAYVRPLDEGMQDLRVVIGPGTAVRGVDGEQASLARAGFGDTITVRGAAESGYVLASELVLSRSVAAGFVADESRGAGTVARPATNDADSDKKASKREDDEPARRIISRPGSPGRGRALGRAKDRND